MVGEQGGDGLASAQIAALARGQLAVVFTAAIAQLGEIDLPGKGALLFRRQRREVGARLGRVAGVAVALGQPQQQLGLVGLEGQALIEQRTGRIGGFVAEIAREEARIVRPRAPAPACSATAAPARVSPGATGPRLTTLALSSINRLRPADISITPGPATMKLLWRMSRPACTSDTSERLVCTNRLPLAVPA